MSPDPAGALPTIQIRGLSKHYGPLEAVSPLNLEVGPRQIVGLIGPNGAGKTTILKMLTGMLSPTAGTAVVAGFDVTTQPVEVKRRVGFAPDSDAVFESLTGLEFLELIATLYSVPVGLAHKRIFRMVDLLDLDRRVLAGRLLGTYSKGMRRKVTIAAALLHNPPVVLLDEPLEGLDPNATTGLKSLLRTLAGEGKTIVYSSHLLDVVERLCDRLIVLDRGRVVLEGPLDDLVAAGRSGTLETLFARLTGRGSLDQKVADVARALTDGGPGGRAD